MAGASEAELTERDLAMVMTEIHESQKHAYYVGLVLGLPSEKLDNIKMSSSDDREQLLLVTKEFLRRIEPRPTWSAIATALRSPLVGMTELAERIEQKYCPPPKQEAETVSIATDQLSPEMGSSVPQVELSELERRKKKSTTTGLDDPQQMIEEPTSKPRSGKQTSEYTRVRQSLDAITQVLDVNRDANQRLRQKFQKERWLSVGSDTGGERLVTVALSRIEQDAGQFQQFIDMLNDIDGMDQIVKKLTVKEEDNSGIMNTIKKEKKFDLGQKKNWSNEEVTPKPMKVSMATDQLSPEMRWSVPQVERLPLHDGELSELERGKKKSTTTSLDDPQQMIEEDNSTEDNSAEPLFSKDTVYHAGICCQALASCTTGDYKTFFKDEDKVPGHSFEAISISRPSPGQPHERYLIAKQGESKYYIAFESQPDLSLWQKKHRSFIEGIQDEKRKFPVRYIVELLNKRGCSIVLTGFSFGGMLACSIAAGVWDTPYISTDVLKKSLVCITFGQPHIIMPTVASVASERPDMVSVIHTIHLQDDVVPRLLPVLNECCSELHVGPNKPFQDPKTRQNMEEYLFKLQNPKTEKNLSEIKCILNDFIPYLAAKKPKVLESEMYTAHHIVCEPPPVGLVMRETTAEEDKMLSSCPLLKEDAENLQVELYKQHQVSHYMHKMSNGFLKRPPEYNFPTSPKTHPPDVEGLKPTLSSVVIHRHGNELAVAIEGSNLWFSYQISLHGTEKIIIPGDKSNGTSIQYNLSGDQEDKISVEEDKVKVSLHTCFSSKPVSYYVPVEKERYSVSTRQRQLAVLTPSQLIELAYLSALLEQYPFHNLQPISDKVENIKDFLEKVVQVVPLESIIYAMKYSSYKVAMFCAKTLYESKINLPISHSMFFGLDVVGQYLKEGAHSEIDAVEGASLHKIGKCVHLRDEEMKYEVKWVRKDVCNVIVQSIDDSEAKHWYSFLVSSKNIDGSEAKKFAEIPDDENLQRKYLKALKHLTYASYISSLRLFQLRNLTTSESDLICEISIDHLYQGSHSENQHKSLFKSPLDILREGKSTLTCPARELFDAKKKKTSKSCNVMMLEKVNKIREFDLAICAALLGGFMEQQRMGIPLVKSQSDRCLAFEVEGPASVGIWALSSLKYEDIHPKLSQYHGKQLLVSIEPYIKSISSQQFKSNDKQYSAKLQFMVQGLKKTVTYNSQYVSYSLERQLVEICKERKVDSETSLDELKTKWDGFFKENILSLVACTHRSLVARWLKWALMVHSLREKLAEYTAVGVVGLVNSGKSRLVSSLFKIPIPAGTTDAKRTTIPFMYNLEQRVDGLDVVDFPGVDDRDETIPDLAELLLFLTQVVIFVVDYRRAHTESAKKWLEKLKEKENVPVLVCLTFADHLYTEIAKQICGKETQKFPGKLQVQPKLKEEMEVIVKKLQPPSSHTVQFFSFNQDWGSILNSEEGREKLREAGIGTVADVGEWLVGVFRDRFDQEDLADRLESFIHKKES